MTPVLLFGTSFTLLLSFIGVRAYEVKRNMRFAASLRAQVDARLARTFAFMRTARISEHHKRAFRASVQYFLHQAVVTVLAFVRKVEARLMQVADSIRGKRIAAVAAAIAPSSSTFLQTIVEHKDVFKKTARKVSRRKKTSVVSSSAEVVETLTPSSF